MSPRKHKLTLEDVKKMKDLEPGTQIQFRPDGTVKLITQEQIKERNQALFLGVIVGTFVGFDISIFYDIVQQVFAFNIVTKLLLLVGISYLTYEVIKRVKRGEMDMNPEYV